MTAARGALAARLLLAAGLLVAGVDPGRTQDPGGPRARPSDAPGAAAPEFATADDRRPLASDEFTAYGAVGRLNIAGRRFCSATLIGERLVLTAAHCLFHPRTGAAIPPEELRFVPGPRPRRDVRASAVARVALAPGFALLAAPRPEDLRADIALLELERPVETAVAAPLATGPLLRRDGAPRIVAYTRDRPWAPSLSPSCPPIGNIAEVLVLGCAIDRGVSGAPALAGEGAETRVVAVVSSMGRLPGGEEFTLAVAVAPWLAALRAELAKAAAPVAAPDGGG